MISRINHLDLKKIKILGKGGFANVYLCEDKNKNKYVVKEIFNLTHIKDIIKEIDINKILSKYPNCHPQITCLYDYFLDQKQNKYIIIYKYLPGYTDLFNLLINFIKYGINYNIFNKVFRNVINAIKYIHSKNIIHRDIKENNILINNDGDVAIIDFGVSNILPIKYKVSLAGTPGYIDPYTKNVNNCYISDTFSTGMMFYKFLTNTSNNEILNYFKGTFKDYDEEYEKNYRIILNKIDSINFPPQYHYYNKLLKHMLNPYGIRPSMSEISEYLKNDGKTPLVIEDYKKCFQKYSQTSRKTPRKTSRKTSRKTPRKTSRKTSRKTPRKTSRKTARKTSRKTSRKVSKKTSKKTSRKVSKKTSRKTRKPSRNK